MEFIVFLIFLVVLAVTLVTGLVGARRHDRQIRRLEDETLTRPAVTFRSLPDERIVERIDLAQGSVVMGVDYSRRFFASLKHLFGGELGYHSSMLDRARREALLRMKKSVPDADLYLNTRLETAALAGVSGNATGVVEIVAYSTAIRFAR